MARRIIQPDLLGREEHRVLNAREEWLAGVRHLTKWLTIPGSGFAAVMLLTHIASVADGWDGGWRWMLRTSIGMAAASAQSAVRLKWRRWSWLLFMAALAVHGYGMYRCYLAFAGETGVMDGVPPFEMVMLGALLVLHGLWSLLERPNNGAEG